MRPTNGLVLTTNTIVRVAPVQLTADQMDGIIQAVQGSGIVTGWKKILL